MGVFFHILSTGGGAGASRITRYIAERDKNLEREGPGSRRLFSEDQDNLSYHRADRILEPEQGQPDKDDLIHFSVMVEEEEFDRLGGDEKEKQARFRDAVREAMKGMAAELNIAEITWVAGIHRNSQNPHVHIVMSKEASDRRTGRPRRVSRIPKRILPHKEVANGKEVIVNGPIGDKFVAALEKQQALNLNQIRQQQELTADQKCQRLARQYQKQIADHDRERRVAQNKSAISLDHRKIAASWSSREQVLDNRASDFRVALGKRLALEMRLLFAEVRHDRAVRHGGTYRFAVMDQSTGEERKISELDVHRRAAARASRLAKPDHDSRNQALEADLAHHVVTFQELAAAREAKIEALEKDIGSLRGVLSKVEQRIVRTGDMPAVRALTPLVSRETLSELQEQTVRLNLPECTAELEKLRMELAHENSAPTRTDTEAASLSAQLNVARADLRTKETRLERFEALSHLTNYEVGGDRWSLASLDKQIARRNEDAKLIPDRAARLDLRSLARINYSTSSRQQAAGDVEHLSYVRTELVRLIEERRAPLITDRNLAQDMVDVLQNAYEIEDKARGRNKEVMPEPTYERNQINALESSAETLRDTQLLKEVHEWEKKHEPEITWEGRAVAREVMSEVAVRQTNERLQSFVESKRIVSLNIGDYRTGTLREVEARTLTDHLVRALETNHQRDHRHSINLAAHDHHGRLVSDFEKAKDYYATARDLASDSNSREPNFTDKERINLEIYAEQQNDEMTRDQFLELARTDDRSERDVVGSRDR
jgi:hypothetical protein